MNDIKNLSIKEWATEDRPREKMLSKGIETLSNAELIAILIGSGSRNESAVDLSKKILSRANNNLNELGKFSIEQLKQFKGIGEAKAITIVAAMELGKRRKLSEIIEKKQISGSQDAFSIFHPIISDLKHEEFWVAYLNKANKLMFYQRISQGGLSSTVIDVRIIMKYGLEKSASSMILCHNHPSGNTEPSKSDIEITRKISEAGKIMDIKLLDHIIIGDNSYFSFADEGII